MKCLDDALDFAAERAEHYSHFGSDPEFLKYFAASILANAYSDCTEEFEQLFGYAERNISEV